MKPSDFVSTSSQRNELARDLLHTEETDAVNTGLVDSADKRRGYIGSESAVRKAAKGGTSVAALASITKGRDAAPDRDVASSGMTSDSASAPFNEAGASDTSLASGTRAKIAAVGSAKWFAASAVHKQLEGTELEGADDLYYKGRVITDAAKRLRARLTGSTRAAAADASASSVSSTAAKGKGVAKADKPLKGLANKGYADAKSTSAAKRTAQMSTYFKRSVYSNAAPVRPTIQAHATSVIHRIGATVGGGLKGAFAAFAGASMPVILGVIALILLVAALGGAAGASNSNRYEALNEVENQIASFFLSKGLDELHTAAIMGNMYAESSMDPGCIEVGGTGIGICQWSFGRANALRSYAASQGKSWTDLSVQLDFFWSHDSWDGWSGSYIITRHEFEGDPAVGERVSGSRDGFFATDDLNEATKQFCYGWEKPGIPRINVRLEAAQRYYTTLMSSPAGSAATSAQRQTAINAALAQVGKPYGHANNGYEWDCNGLTNYAWAQAGVSIPYPSGTYGYGQFQWLKSSGRWVTSVDQLQPGDLVFFSRDGGYHCYHVALYLGNNNVVHAVGYGKGIMVTSIWYCSGFCGGGSPV